MRHHVTHHAGADPDLTGVVAWRRRQLLRAGFDSALAAPTAADRRIDLHALLELVDRGCPHRLALRIVAPLDGWQEPPL